MANVLVFFLVAHLLIFLPNPIAILAAASTNNSGIDIQALIDFKQGITNDPYGVLSSWTSSLYFCSWTGVTCGKALPLRVVSLELNSFQLDGQLSSSLANLTSVRRLDIGNNIFFGSIPKELGTLPKLRYLFLASNNLLGNIPESLGTASRSLGYVNLAYNDLSGGIPYSLATSSSLTVLNLTSNKISGMIPDSLFNGSSGLVILSLRQNFLNGLIPDFHKMARLQILDLAQNNLSRSIPPSLGNVSSLTEIYLDSNYLEGSIPESLSQIGKLNRLVLSENNLVGHVPAQLYNLSSLILLDLSQNNLTGQIPSFVGFSLPNLAMLIMSSNNFKGSIPASLANATKIEVIDLYSNSLAGPLPSLGSLPHLVQLRLGINFLKSDIGTFITSLTNCSSLMSLSIYANRFAGSLPISVGNLSSSLQTLDLGMNRIVGTIPVVLSNLHNLVSLNLAQNQISGKLPKEIGNFVRLQLLAMGQNSIFGEIPSSIVNLSSLVVLQLSQNRLSGQITHEVGFLTQLTRLSLDSNSLSGNIPASLGQCNQLSTLNMSANNLDGYIPTELLTITTLVSLDLSRNNLTGSMPQQSGLINLLNLDISNNYFSGKIPPSLGQCFTLSSLHMESNQLDGIIPLSFENLTAIQTIDLSQNKLTGQIPDFFNRFKTLELLDLSYNNFDGPIPTGGVFENTTAVILDGNIGLCANATTFASVFSMCPRISIGGAKKNAHLLLMVIPPITVAIFLFLFICFVATLKNKRAHTTPCYKETMKKVSYGDILKATNWLSPVNKISSSRTGSIYIGRFEFDTDLVAIKVFHLNEHGSLKSFLMECEVLRNTRHRNLMKAVTLCSTVDMENNEFKAIVFYFMANGSLDMWLHPKLHKNRPKRALSLGQRIRIAMDVASALDYMHNQLRPPLVHCDLKPANVLLDYDITARVGDFGSAKFLSSSPGTPEDFVGMEGTIGYIAPEYGVGYKISTGCDVYSFGVLLLEMLTGKRPTDIMFSDGMSLHKLVSPAYPNALHEVLDPYMFQEGDLVFATLTLQCYLVPLIEIALLCSMELPKDRPGIRDICAKILEISEAFLKPRCLH